MEMSHYERQHSDDEKTWTPCDCPPEPDRLDGCARRTERLLCDGMVIGIRWRVPGQPMTGRVFDPPIRPDLPWGEQVEIDPKRVVSPKPAPTMCGCGRHEIDPKGDAYAQHREWSFGWANGRDHTPEGRWPRDNASHFARGIGVSAPEPEPLAVQDPTGDDVAPDAYRTTGGRTLDDVIDAHIEARPVLVAAADIDIEYT
jgi:hypothetical protein